MVALAANLLACGGAGTSVVGSDVPTTPLVMQGPPGDASTMGTPRACTATSECAGACAPGASTCTCASTPMGMRCVQGCSTTSDCPSGGAQSFVCETQMHLCVPAGDGGAPTGDGGAPPQGDGGAMMPPPGDGGAMMPPPGDGGAMMPPGDGGAMMPPPGDGGAMMPPGDGGAMMMPPGDGGAMTPRTCTSSADCTGACPGTPTGCGCGATPMGMRCVPTCTSSAQCPMGMNGTTLMCRSGFCAP